MKTIKTRPVLLPIDIHVVLKKLLIDALNITTVGEVNVNGFLKNNIKNMSQISQCVKIYQLCQL